MDAYDTVTAKAQAIFRELAGSRAEALRGERAASQANDILGKALASEQDPFVADEIAFHLLDWNSDAAFVVAFLLFPDRFTAEELRVGVEKFLVHVPAHISAAARLGGYEKNDLQGE